MRCIKENNCYYFIHGNVYIPNEWYEWAHDVQPLFNSKEEDKFKHYDYITLYISFTVYYYILPYITIKNPVFSKTIETHITNTFANIFGSARKLR